MSSNERASARTTAWSFTVDLVLVLAFAALGRASHETAPFGIGLVTTAWPFVTALVIAWLAASVFHKPTAVAPTGLVIWAVTVTGGLGIRVLSGDTAALPFVIVATITLALLLLGWRIIATLVTRKRRA